jgi:hypothetical protein
MPTESIGLDLSHVDYGALTGRISRADVRAFRAQIHAAQRANPGVRTGLRTASGTTSLIGLGIFGLVFVIVLVNVFGSLASDPGEGVPGGIVVLGLMLVAFCTVALIFVLAHFGAGGDWAKWMRLSRFAAANGLRFHSLSAGPGYPGCVFQVGDSRQAYDHLSTTSGRYVDLGNYRYTTGSGKSRTTHHWGYVALRLDRELPNMVLDSKANNGLFGGTNLPQTFDRNQILHLEGDFDKYFTLYCPKQYEQDALYVFTPDLMALLVDDAAPFDVEIVDDWMFVYSASAFRSLDAATYARLFHIVETVGNKAVSQTERYHDDHVVSPGANIVAPQGQRLRHRTSISTIVIFGGILAFWIYNLVQGNFS